MATAWLMSHVERLHLDLVLLYRYRSAMQSSVFETDLKYCDSANCSRRSSHTGSKPIRSAKLKRAGQNDGRQLPRLGYEISIHPYCVSGYHTVTLRTSEIVASLKPTEAASAIRRSHIGPPESGPPRQQPPRCCLGVDSVVVASHVTLWMRRSLRASDLHRLQSNPLDRRAAG
jgi:hypothetical protein